MNRPTLENTLSTGSYQDELFASALGWKAHELFILNRAIVISVKLGVELNPQAASTMPQFSINARIIGEDVSSENPENEITKWFAPLMSNGIVSVPEVGEQVFVIRETTLNKSKGFWISRVNDTDKVSLKLTNDHNKNLNPEPMSRYGMRFNVEKLNANSRQNSPKQERDVFQLPLNLGDVLMQGRSGSYIRHSYLPIYSEKPATLEMGILEDRVYQVNAMGSVGSTKTKTIHFSNTKPLDISDLFTKKQNELIPDDSDVKRDFIVNFADETYNISTTSDSELEMHRSVLGEKLNSYLQENNGILLGFVRNTRQLLLTVEKLFDSYIDHEHAIPEINVDIPDKVVLDKQTVNRGFRTESQPSRRVFVPAQRVRVPSTGDVFETVRVVNQSNGSVQRVRRLVARGTPGSTITIPSKFVTVPSPPKTINLGYRTIVKKRRIKFDTISIGGDANPRFTVPIETDKETSDIEVDINTLRDEFTNTRNVFINLSNTLIDHLSKRHFIN